MTVRHKVSRILTRHQHRRFDELFVISNHLHDAFSCGSLRLNLSY